jgi:hypothetical protein
MTKIQRFNDTFVVTANSSAATTAGVIPFGTFGGGCVIVASTNGCTQIQWHGAATPSATPVRVYADGAAVATAVTNGVHPIPEACYALPYVYPIVVGGTTCALTVAVKG